MKTLGLNEIREKYLSFFESKGHLRAPSFSLVPREGERGLLLINSGMAPLKPYFSGEEKPPAKRMTTCQKCIRVIDIEQVGKTSRHGTFFEMLGNFSFGDYFKREAAGWAWEFCTKVMELPDEKLFVSVYHEDDEAYDIWTKEIGVDPSHMVRLGKKDNFWEIGAGPCGPCSEIYYDRGEENGCGDPNCAPGCDCDRFVEFWNLVFTQFNNDGEGNYTPLANKNIDTGMGLERIACIMQGVNSLFDVDTIRDITTEIANLAGVSYGADAKKDVSLRIITDHIRSTVMLVCDGVMPSNEGRGYVLRRLLRRAARHGKLLGIKEPFLYKVCDTVIRVSGEAYPELKTKAEFIRQVIKIEEERFEQTIDAGLRLLNEKIGQMKAAGETVFSGKDAFMLYDTFGFPIDLIEEILLEENLKIDRETFEECMQEQRKRAREARAAMGDQGWAQIDLGLDKSISTVFTGYDSFEERARVLAVVSNGEVVKTALDGERVTVVLDRTPFYAESGGQVADMGEIEGEAFLMRVDDVKKTGDGKFMHMGEILSGMLSVGDRVTAKIDIDRRRAIMRAHSATHILQRALRERLGDHVEQSGSLVEPDRLRFDFTHFEALSPEDIEYINNTVNDRIMDGLTVNKQEMPIDEAKKLGAMAIFGEKYGDIVRVVTMGDYSVELCGGTHVANTGNIGPFSIESESSVAAGIRRIEARVGRALLEEYHSDKSLLHEMADNLKAPVNEIKEKLSLTLNELKETRKELFNTRVKIFRADAEQALLSASEISGLRVFTMRRSGIDAATMRSIGDYLKDKSDAVVAVLASEDAGKITFLAVCGKKAVEKGIKAGELVSAVSAAAGGKGGGRPDSAMGGGSDISKLDSAMSLVESFVSGKVN